MSDGIKRYSSMGSRMLLLTEAQAILAKPDTWVKYMDHAAKVAALEARIAGMMDALKEVLSCLPPLWGDELVDGTLDLQVDEHAIHQALYALDSRKAE